MNDDEEEWGATMMNNAKSERMSHHPNDDDARGLIRKFNFIKILNVFCQSELCDLKV